jgi:hypothetical protein
MMWNRVMVLKNVDVENLHQFLYLQHKRDGFASADRAAGRRHLCRESSEPAKLLPARLKKILPVSLPRHRLLEI